MRWKQGLAYAANSVLSKIGTRVIQEPVLFGRERESIKIKDGDYIRYASFLLAAHEIIEYDVQGDVAELGVYRGKFAKYINSAFPDRTLYLFDTFEGYDERDKERAGESDDNRPAVEILDTAHCSDTSIDLVLGAMKHPSMCRIVKGYFPETLDTLPDADSLEFCFVSIDVNLYKPIYSGLCYFYDRLSPGGYIFVHDYNFSELPGVKAAVERFVRERSISYVPLPDILGSIAIARPR